MKLTLALSLFATPALAAGMHAGGHVGDELMAIGRPGIAAEVDRTVQIAMVENEDGSMSFDPVSVTVKKGETVRLAFTNKGHFEHEFVMDTHEQLIKHQVEMANSPELKHVNINAILIASKEKGEIVWTFTNPGKFDFACLIPSHYDLGMKGSLTVIGNRDTIMTGSVPR